MALPRKGNKTQKRPSDFEDVEDSIIVREKLTRLEIHAKEAKEHGKNIDLITIALLGTDMNGKEGLVKKIDNMSQDIKDMNKFRETITNQTALMQRELSFGKWVFGIVFIVIVGGYAKDKYEENKTNKKELIERLNLKQP